MGVFVAKELRCAIGGGERDLDASSAGDRRWSRQDSSIIILFDYLSIMNAFCFYFSKTYSYYSRFSLAVV